jgi:hypothetical protein
MTDAVKHKFESYPDDIRSKMIELRSLIYEVAESTDSVGTIEETLKWGEPAYLTTKPKSGTTIRIDWKTKSPEMLGFYVNCSTSLVETYRSIFSDKLYFEGNRAILIPVNESLPR